METSFPIVTSPPNKNQQEPKPVVDPVAKDPKFFEWLEGLFAAEGEFPEKLEVRIVTGKQLEKFGPLIKHVGFAPAAATEAAIKAGAGRRKPSREDLVHLSNEILARIQRDTDESNTPTTYGILAWQISRETEPYERWIKRCKPEGKWAKGDRHDLAGQGQSEDDDSPKSMAERYGIQALAHDERMFQLLGGVVEGLVDRMDRVIERQEQSLENLRARYERQQEITERAMSLEAEREEKRMWTGLKIRATERAVNLGLDLAPPFIAQLTGKSSISKDTPESIALKNFFKKEEDGGKLTQAQQNAAFGVYDDNPPHAMIKKGVLSTEQAKLLWDVAQTNVSADELDRLVPGSGDPLEVTMEQIFALQNSCGFAMEQLAPLVALFTARQGKKK